MEDFAATSAGAVSVKMLEFLVCPVTGHALEYDKERQVLVSQAAGLAFPVTAGIPVMLVDEAKKIAT